MPASQIMLFQQVKIKIMKVEALSFPHVCNEKLFFFN
jgi:hypothetical protein